LPLLSTFATVKQRSEVVKVSEPFSDTLSEGSCSTARSYWGSQTWTASHDHDGRDAEGNADRRKRDWRWSSVCATMGVLL
jgi:hypothetical protein